MAGKEIKLEDPESDDALPADPRDLCDESINESQPIQAQMVNHFWSLIESYTGTFVPIYIKNIMRLNNLDNPLAFKSITDDVLAEVEAFARTEMIRFVEPHLMGDYYSHFADSPTQFKFMIGDKVLIKELVNFVKSQTVAFWQFRKRPIEDAPEAGEPSSSKRKCSADYANEDPVKARAEGERQILETLIKNSLKKWPVENLPEEARIKLEENAPIEVSISEIYNYDIYSNGFASYVAQIKCPLCSHSARLTKCSRSSATNCSGQRWVISNFIRHLNNHNKKYNASFDPPNYGGS